MQYSLKLTELAKQHAASYQSNTPFPHIRLDNVFPENVLEDVVAEFPDISSEAWNYKRVDENEIKMASNIEAFWSEKTVEFLRYLNSQEFLRFLTAITGIQNLIPDPDYFGGGLHQIVKGGRLQIHADFNKHPKNNLDRRINVLIYLNKNWQDEWNGALELWDTSMDHCVQKISPLFNRMVIFSTTSNSFHGHPDFLKTPEGVYRRSIALYYYTNGRPEEESNAAHSTLFKQRPVEEKNTRQYLLRLKRIAGLFIPPIFSAIAYKLKNKNK